MALIDKLLREFAKENFGDKEGHYFPVVHGRTQNIKLFTLVVKESRYVLERPFKRYTYKVVAGLENYVADGKREEYEALRNKKVQKHNEIASVGESEDGSGTGATSTLAVGAHVAKIANFAIEINEDLGSLELGGIDQEYILDPDLRDVLAKTELDINKTGVFEDQELRLITSVIYSERFAVKGNRKCEVEADAGINIPGHVHSQIKGKYKNVNIPPNIATRANTRGPFLFQCCRVVLNKDKNRLELPKGEFVGRPVNRCKEDEEEEEKEKEKEEYKNTAVSLVDDMESYLIDSFTNEDSAKLEEITTSVLKPSKNREERKERVKKYLQWFEKALSTTPPEGNRVLTLDKPLNDADCEFLRTIFVPATKNHSTFSFPIFFDEEKLQGYAIVLKIISDLSEETWDEIEKVWAETDEPLE